MLQSQIKLNPGEDVGKEALTPHVNRCRRFGAGLQKAPGPSVSTPGQIRGENSPTGP